MRATARTAFRTTLQRHAKSSLSLQGKPLRIGIIGGGPAGFYAAARLLSLPGSEATKVDLFEILPVPFGLSRFGVAPDHPEVKNCEHKFEETAQDPRFRFHGNVQITGTNPSPKNTLPPSPLAAQIPLSALRQHYDALLFTYGASLDRSLDIPGENAMKGILSARSFVNWYNGHPYSSALLQEIIDLSKVEHVTVIGQGNVAMDVGRILLKSVDELRETDLPEYALAELSRSRVKRVDIVGRRGPLQLASTTKELREMMSLEDVAFDCDTALLHEAKELLIKEPKMLGARARNRAIDLLLKGSPLTQTTKSWSFQFLRSPTAFHPLPSSSPHSPSTADSIGSISYELNSLVPPRGWVDGDSFDPSALRAVGTGKEVSERTDLVMKSVGYRSIGLAGLPFDERSSTIRNVGGRVTEENGTTLQGLYTSGWVARGPNGVIATTMFDAFSTADLVAADLLSLPSSPAKAEPPLVELAGGRRVVSWSDWERIDREERRRGKELGKVREKITRVEELLRFLN